MNFHIRFSDFPPPFTHTTKSINSNKFVEQPIHKRPQHDAEDPTHTNQPTTTTTTTAEDPQAPINQRPPQLQLNSSDQPTTTTPHAPINQRPPQLQLNSSDQPTAAEDLTHTHQSTNDHQN